MTTDTMATHVAGWTENGFRPLPPRVQPVDKHGYPKHKGTNKKPLCGRCECPLDKEEAITYGEDLCVDCKMVERADCDCGCRCRMGQLEFSPHWATLGLNDERSTMEDQGRSFRPKRDILAAVITYHPALVDRLRKELRAERREPDAAKESLRLLDELR